MNVAGSQRYNQPMTGLFDLLQTLEAAGIFHRVGSIRPEAVLVEVRSATTFWEIGFLADGEVLYEAFRSTGAILDGRGFVELVMQWADTPPATTSLDQRVNELAVMRLLRDAEIYFSADQILMRKIMIEGAIMIEVAVPGERWEIDVLPNGEIEVERFRTEVGLHDFDAEALRRLLASAGEAAPHRRKALRG